MTWPPEEPIFACVEVHSMTVTISSHAFNQDVSRAKKAAERGPVIITDRGKPSHVLMRHADYERIAHGPISLVEALAQKEGGDFDFEPPRMGDGIMRPVDFD
jgi:hypothetical protein